ncbi:hypothetical protein SLAVM298S_07980 [Streptomyces lavendulae subsp. lavendulae]
MLREISTAAAVVRASEDHAPSDEWVSLAAGQRQQRPQRGQQGHPLADPLRGLQRPVGEVRPDALQEVQVRRRRPGDVQRAQGQPSDEDQMSGQQGPAQEAEPDRELCGGGGAAAALMTVHTSEDAPPGGPGSGPARESDATR